MSHDASTAVTAHWSVDDLEQRLLDALRSAGKDLDALTPDDLAPVDELHSRGREATVELADLSCLTGGMAVLDVGSGLGGPARYLAGRFGCHVTGIELTPAFCQVARRFSALTGMDERTTFRQGDALALPFADAAFDAVWTVQAQMNIADKARFYGEIHRVLKPGGRFVFQDIFAGPSGLPPLFPVPWSSDGSISFLAPPDEVRGLLAALGFREVEWRDRGGATVAHQQAAQAKRGAPKADAPLPPLGIHLLLGQDFAAKRANSAQSLAEGRVTQLQAVLVKAG